MAQKVTAPAGKPDDLSWIPDPWNPYKKLDMENVCDSSSPASKWEMELEKSGSSWGHLAWSTLNSGKEERPCLKNKVEKQRPRLASDLQHT